MASKDGRSWRCKKCQTHGRRNLAIKNEPVLTDESSENISARIKHELAEENKNKKILRSLEDGKEGIRLSGEEFFKSKIFNKSLWWGRDCY